MSDASTHSEKELLRTISAGSRVAFETIYKQHYIAIYHFAKRFVADTQAAEDITTETFVKLWERFANFDSLPAIKSFLFTSARNACLNQQRSDKRADSRHQEFTYLLSGYENDETITGTVYQYIYDEIEKLPEPTRKIFKMAYADRLSNESIAQSLGLTNQSVRNYKTRALKTLRMALLEKDLFAFFLSLYLYRQGYF